MIEGGAAVGEEGGPAHSHSEGLVAVRVSRPDEMLLISPLAEEFHRHRNSEAGSPIHMSMSMSRRAVYFVHGCLSTIAVACVSASVASDSVPNIDLGAEVGKVHLSDERMTARLEDCTLTISIGYPGQCLAGSQVGLMGKEISVDLSELEDIVTYRLHPVDAGVGQIRMNMERRPGEVVMEANEIGQKAVRSSQSLGPDERQNFASEQVEKFLQSNGVISRTILRTCTGLRLFQPTNSQDLKLAIDPSRADVVSNFLADEIAACHKQ